MLHYGTMSDIWKRNKRLTFQEIIKAQNYWTLQHRLRKGKKVGSFLKER